jgi:hypothetical protein
MFNQGEMIKVVWTYFTLKAPWWFKFMKYIGHFCISETSMGNCFSKNKYINLMFYVTCFKG